MPLPNNVQLSDQLVKFSGRVRRDAIEPANPAVREDGEGDGVIRGVVATEAEVVHWVPGAGAARIVLEVTETIVNGWGIDSLPLMKDHDRRVDAIIGRMRNLRAADGEVWFDADFDPELGATYKGAVERGTITDLSVTADIFELALAETETDDKLPLYRAINWKPAEGSLVWRGADDSATFRRARMSREEIAKMLRAAGIEATDEQIDAAMATMATNEPGSEVKRGALAPEPAPAPATLSASPEQIAELVSAEVKRHLATATPAAPAPVDPAQAAAEKAMENAVTAARKFGLPEDVIERHKDTANGDAHTFGLLMRGYLADRQVVPSVAPRRRSDSVQGGYSGYHEALADMGACLRRQAGAATEDDEKRLAKIASIDANASLPGLVERAARALNPQAEIPYDRGALLNEFGMATSSLQIEGFQRKEGLPGMRFVRSSSGGLAPGDFPSVLADVMYNVLLESYDLHRLPYDDLARVRIVEDTRPVNMTRIGVAGRFEALKPGENLHPVTVREEGEQFEVHPFGHYLTLDWATWVNDYLNTLVQLPTQLGEWHAAQCNRLFTEAVVNAAYNGEYDRQVPDVLDFASILEVIRSVALKAPPINPRPNEDPRNDPGKTYALIPSVMVHGNQITLPWQRYTANLASVIQRQDIRVPWEVSLQNNSNEALYSPALNYYLWPGPKSSMCPFTVGQIRGMGLTVQSGMMSPPQQAGVWISVNSTFGAALTRANRAFRVRPAT